MGYSLHLEIVQKHGVAVPYGIGVFPYPFAKDEETGLTGEHEVELYVAVTKYEKRGGGMVVKILLGEDDKRFVCLALKGFFRFYVMRQDIAQSIAYFTVVGNKKCVAVLGHCVPSMLQTAGLCPS